ncbi:hypothetical protein NDU88_006792 [Pleurodeles waltl]|uniref:Uncharacterized protein n=1 Tax=Pleurodeles waltl TaxID=8319 RepID=A0AAV7QMT2_PLEWA|nr:hypothetical protein NDU88_006792 [Pleurodeles waltl]
MKEPEDAEKTPKEPEDVEKTPKEPEYAEKMLKEPEEAEKRLEEPEHLEGAGDASHREREADQRNNEPEQRDDKKIEGEQSTDKIDKTPFWNNAAHHVPGETWLTQVCTCIRELVTTLFGNKESNHNRRGFVLKEKRNKWGVNSVF